MGADGDEKRLGRRLAMGWVVGKRKGGGDWAYGQTDRRQCLFLWLFGGWRGKRFHSFMDEGKIDMWMMMTAAGGPLAFELARLDRFGAKQAVRAVQDALLPSCRSLVV